MSKIRAEQLASTLKQGLAPVYLVCGDDPLLVQEACDTIRHTATQQGFSERERYHSDSGLDWNDVLTSANSLSLFASRKILDIRLHTGKPGDKGAKALIAYCENPSDDTLMLLVTPKLDGATQKSKWYKAIEKAGVVVPIWPINAGQLPRWIGERMKKAGLSADSQAIDILANRVEGNLLAAVQEIEKLTLLATSGMVSAQMMAASVADSARYDVFTFVDKALQGDLAAAVKTLHGLKGEGTDAVVILWALAKEIRALNHVSQATRNHQNFAWACKQAGVWEKRQGLIKSALQRLKPAQITLLLRKASAIDKMIKGMHSGDAWNELLDLTINLTGTFSLSREVQKLALSSMR